MELHFFGEELHQYQTCIRHFNGNLIPNVYDSPKKGKKFLMRVISMNLASN